MCCAKQPTICPQRRLPVLDLLQEEEAGDDETPYNGREEGLRYRDWIANTFVQSMKVVQIDKCVSCYFIDRCVTCYRIDRYVSC